MAAILNMLGRSRKTTAIQRPPLGKRLQKRFRGKGDGNVQSRDNPHNSQCGETTIVAQSRHTICDVYPNKLTLQLDEVLDKDFVDSCLDLVFKSAQDLTLVSEQTETVQGHPLKTLLHKQSTVSSDSASFYSIDEMLYSDFKRTRAKTPVFMIGQLEKISEQERLDDQTQRLAEEYQSFLPLRPFTPCPSTRGPRTLRKIKCQVSLRDLVAAQEEMPESPRSEYSEGETLIGSGSNTPYAKSPRNSVVRKPSSPTQNKHYEQPEVRESKPQMAHDIPIGMKICTDLLTNELASALSKHDRVEINHRASELQILLMIEAYEMVQKQIQEKRAHLHVPDDHVSSFELLLDHWLSVLYTVYDQSQEKARHEEMMEWQCKSPLPIRLSTEYRRT